MRLTEVNYSELSTTKAKCIYFSKSESNKVVKGYKELYRLSDITKLDNHSNLYLELEYQHDYIQSIYLWENYNTICMQLNYINDMELSRFIDILANYQYFTYEGLKTLVATKYVNSQFINLVEIEVLAINNDMELAKHYSNYRAEFYAKREAEEQNARVVREQLEKEEEEKHKQEINNKLAEAEKKILAKQLVSNDSIEESTLLLMLFKKYNINVPLKTQGWINKALAQVSYNDKTNNYTYSYYTSSKNSTVFREYFDQLISAIKHAYNQVTEEEKAIQEIVNTVKQKETDFLNSIQSISFEKCNNILREQMEFRQLLRNGKQKEFILEEVEALAKRAYKALKVDNINNSVLNYMRLYNPNKANKRLSFSKNNITITIEAVEQNNKIIYQFIKQYSNKSDTYIYKEVA